MATEHEKFLYTVHFMVQAEVRALLDLVCEFASAQTGRDPEFFREKWRLSAREQFSEVLSMTAVMAPSPVPAWEMQKLADRIWGDGTKPGRPSQP
jgi:hypothetical protein